MSDTSPRGPISAAQLLADALLRSLTGTTAHLRVTNANAVSSQSELGLVTTTFVNVNISPVVMRKLRPNWSEAGGAQWELLVSATSVEQQVSTMELPSAFSLFELTLAVTIAGQSYLVESFTSNEAFGRVYLYRLLLREAKTQGL
jgi:hypothetical protein